MEVAFGALEAFFEARWYIISVQRKHALKCVIWDSKRGGALILFTLRGRLHVTSPSFCILFFFIPYFVRFSFLSFSLFLYFLFFVFFVFVFFLLHLLHLLTYLLTYLLTCYLITTIIIIYNILILFVCVYMCPMDVQLFQHHLFKKNHPSFIELIWYIC